MELEIEKWQWIGEPADCSVSSEKIEIFTKPHTDLWQRTYYHFRNDNATMLQTETEEKFFPLPCKRILKVNAVLTNAEL